MIRRLLALAIALVTATVVMPSTGALAADATPTSYLRVLPLTDEDCKPGNFWVMFKRSCIPGTITIGITKDAYKTFQFAELYRVEKVKNDKKFCKGLQGVRAKSCLKGSHYTRIKVPTWPSCDYETVWDYKGNPHPDCVVKRYKPESDVLPPGNYVFNLYKDTPSQWKCSVYYKDVCRWSNGYSVTGDILFTWDGSQVLSERVIDEIFL